MSQEHSRTLTVSRKLGFGLLISAVILAAEVVGGLLANSLALLADAGHVLADVIALGLSWYGVRQAQRPPDQRMTFGYHRVGVLVAVTNALTIFAVAVVIIYEAVRRFGEPPEVRSSLMLGVAALGLLANLVVVIWLRRERQGNLNVRSAFWHALGDALASVGVIVGGAIIAFSRLYIIDPIVGALIGLIIVAAAWDIFRDGLRVLLEAKPAHLDMQELVSALKRLPGVKDVHDVHLWSITPALHAMSAHVLVDGKATPRLDAVRRSVEEVLKRDFGLAHTTLQMECQGCGDGEPLCQLIACQKREDNPLGPHKPE